MIARVYIRPAAVALIPALPGSAALADDGTMLSCTAQWVCQNAECAEADEDARITIGPARSRSPDESGHLDRISTDVTGPGAMLVMEGLAGDEFVSLTASGEDQRLLTVTEGRLFYSIHREANRDYGTEAGVETIIGTCEKGD